MRRRVYTMRIPFIVYQVYTMYESRMAQGRLVGRKRGNVTRPIRVPLTGRYSDGR